MIGKQVLAFGKSKKSEFINIGIFAASSGGRKGRLHIGRFMPDRERSHVCSFALIVLKHCRCFQHGMKMCMWFGYNPLIIFFLTFSAL